MKKLPRSEKIDLHNASLRFCSLILTVMLIALTILPLTACSDSESYEGEYKEVQEAIGELKQYKSSKSGSYPAIAFEARSAYANYEPAIVLSFYKEEDIEPACEALKEKLQGKKVPWIYVKTYKPEVTKALKGLDCSGAGLVTNIGEIGTGRIDQEALDLINAFPITRLYITDWDNLVNEYYGINLSSIPVLDSVDELWIGGSNRWSVDYSDLYLKFPSITTLKSESFSHPKGISCFPTLKHFATLEEEFSEEDGTSSISIKENDPQFNAVAILLREANPQLETINDTPAESFDGRKGLNEKGVLEYSRIVQEGLVKQIDTSDYQKIPYSDAELHGKIAVVGLMTNFTDKSTLDNYVSEELQDAFTDDPAKWDVIIRVTSDTEHYGEYTNGEEAIATLTYIEVIDPSAKTITEKELGGYGAPDDTLIRGSQYSGSSTGGVNYEDAWISIDKLFKLAYQKD